jgi:molybdenum cofactor synthesis domain-containing protein
MQKKDKISAGFLIIGDEILSGRTNDQNLNFLAKNLTELGIILCEVRVVRDVENEIIEALLALQNKFDYVFTSGGIGPTHDDITSQAVANAFQEDLILNEDAQKILFQHYGKNNVNEARLKMAYLPRSASLLDNPISSAPGFRIKNVFVMAGIPKIFQAMFEACKKELHFGQKILTKEIMITLTESIIANDFANLQKEYPEVILGSYPFENGTSLVFRCTNQILLEEAMQKMIAILKKISFDSILKIA